VKPDAVIDAHAHIFPREAMPYTDTGTPWHGSILERDKTGAPVITTGSLRYPFSSPLPFESPEGRLAIMDEVGVDVQILSVLPPFFRYELEGETGLEAARAINDDIAELCRTWPDRFIGLATLPLQDPDASLGELTRAMDELGLVGAIMGTHVRGQDLDNPRLFPVLEEMSRRRAFVLCHPTKPRNIEGMESAFLNYLIGGYWDSAVAIASLIFGGVLDRLPDLTFCFTHGGGFAPYAMGRMERAARMQPDEHDLQESPRAYLDRMYFDSLLGDARALRFLVDTVGSDRVVLGTDFAASFDTAATVSTVTDSPLLSEAEKRSITGANAADLLSRLGHLAAQPAAS
jgi:aminocarboxymuconate-semialdehyde decarboxylase